MDELEPITPEQALEYYLGHRAREVSDATLRSHDSRLSIFTGWCNDNDIDNLNDLTGRKLHEYRLWRRNYNGGLKPVSEKTQMDTLRVFIHFVETIDGVQQDLSQKVQSPNLSSNEDVLEVMLTSDRAEAILDYLAKYEYATRAHVVLALEWHTMMRRGAVRALDVQDYDSDDQSLEIHHRPETDTTLKNKEDGERVVALQPELCDLLDDWIEHQRPDVTDEYGREPLVATDHGRIHGSTSLPQQVPQEPRSLVYDSSTKTSVQTRQRRGDSRRTRQGGRRLWEWSYKEFTNMVRRAAWTALAVRRAVPTNRPPDDRFAR